VNEKSVGSGGFRACAYVAGGLTLKQGTRDQGSMGASERRNGASGVSGASKVAYVSAVHYK